MLKTRQITSCSFFSVNNVRKITTSFQQELMGFIEMIQVAFFFFFYSVFPLLQIPLLKCYGYKLLQNKVKYWQLAQSLAWFILPAVQK